MAVPTLKQQRQTDINLLYNPDLPWVFSAETDGAAQNPFYLRAAERKGDDSDQEGRPRRRDVMEVLVRKSDWPAPAYQNLVTVSGSDWAVEYAFQENAHEWRLVLEANVQFGF
ncbi:MAG: hypothetical protein K9J79_03820 [Desulfobacteraceae bacterium]|nr:hypothetical protein [Desulfobacteraceae bacterium]